MKAKNITSCRAHYATVNSLLSRLPGFNQDTQKDRLSVKVAEQITKTSLSPVDERLPADTPIISELLDRDPRMAAIVDQFVLRLSSQIQAMREYMETEQFDEVAQLAHWLKGSGGNLGYPGIVELAAELQRFSKLEDLLGTNAALLAVEVYASRIERGRDPAFLNRSA